MSANADFSIFYSFFCEPYFPVYFYVLKAQPVPGAQEGPEHHRTDFVLLEMFTGTF